jgi:hypothetical protein
MQQYLTFILENLYIFESRNIRWLQQELTYADREKLPWHPERINWPQYWRENQIEGVKKWVQPETVRSWSFRI